MFFRPGLTVSKENPYLRFSIDLEWVDEETSHSSGFPP